MSDDVQSDALDALTGLLSRKGLNALIADFDSRPGDNGAHVGVVLADVDHLLMVNDAYGHAYGDQALAEVARRIGLVAPAGSCVARLGGDEFALLLPVVREVAEVQDAARAILRAFDTPFAAHEIHLAGGNYAEVLAAVDRARLLPGGPNENDVRDVNRMVLNLVAPTMTVSPSTTTIDLRLSLGVAFVERGHAQAGLHDADTAMYEAKRLGRSRAVCLVPEWVAQ